MTNNSWPFGYFRLNSVISRSTFQTLWLQACNLYAAGITRMSIQTGTSVSSRFVPSSSTTKNTVTISTRSGTFGAIVARYSPASTGSTHGGPTTQDNSQPAMPYNASQVR